MIWYIGYEYNCQGHGGQFYCFADDFEQACVIAVQYLTEEYVIDGVGDVPGGNCSIKLVDWKIEPGSVMLFLD